MLRSHFRWKNRSFWPFRIPPDHLPGDPLPTHLRQATDLRGAQRRRTLAAALDAGGARGAEGRIDEYSRWWKSPNWLGIQCGKIFVIQPDSYGFPIFLCFSYVFPMVFLGDSWWNHHFPLVFPAQLSRLDGCSWGALLDQLARQGQTAEALKLIQADPRKKKKHRKTHGKTGSGWWFGTFGLYLVVGYISG